MEILWYNKKAQGATEYLIILAIVIIIALIVAGVLGLIPGMGGSSGSRTSQSYWASADVAIVDPVFSAAGADSITVKNNLPNPVTLTTVSINAQNFAAGESLGAGGSTTLSGALIACTAGQDVSYAVSITYTDSKTGGSYTVTGDGNNLDAVCAN